MISLLDVSLLFFFNDTATTEIYTLSLHDALPIYLQPGKRHHAAVHHPPAGHGPDRKSTRLNSSHANISYAVFCLKKKTYDIRVEYSLNHERTRTCGLVILVGR